MVFLGKYSDAVPVLFTVILSTRHVPLIYLNILSLFPNSTINASSP